MSTVEINWVPRRIDGRSFLMKYEIRDRSYQLYLCDLTSVFEEENGESDVLQRNMELNPSIEIGVERLVTIIKSSLESNLLKIIKADMDEIHLEASSSLGGVPFIWQFCMRLCKAHLLKDLLLSPLLGMAHELIKRQNQLLDIIRKKDTEIEDYKNNGAKVSRAYLETEKFKEEDFLSPDKIIKAEEEEIWNVVFSGSGRSLLGAVSKAVSVVQSDTHSKATDVEPSPEKSKEAIEALLNSQKEAELKRRQELENLSSKVKPKKKKVFKI